MLYHLGKGIKKLRGRSLCFLALIVLLMIPGLALGEPVSEEVSIGVPPLPGVLTIPADRAQPCPAVVLLHGSGPNDRDETLGNTHLFRDLAEELPLRGIAVLRFDKRTLTYGARYTAEQLRAITVREEAMEDAVAAARLLQEDDRIDPGRIYLAGHSLGASIAPRIAAENPGLFAGVILLSGTPRTLGEIVIHQNQAIVDALPDDIKRIGSLQLEGLISEWESVLSGTKEEALNRQVFGQPAYYFWEMAQYDTGEILQTLQVPALILNGGQDFQVTDADGYEAWRQIDLPSTVRLVYLPDLNHLLMAPDAGADVRGTVAEYELPCRVSPEAVNEITQFILE